MTKTPAGNRAATAVLVYPHQLYRSHPAIEHAPEAPVFLVEDPLFFRQFPFRRVPLTYRRLTMEAYRHRLEQQGRRVTVIPSTALETSWEVFRELPPEIRHVVVLEVDDDWLRQAIAGGAKSAGVSVEILDSPGFLLSHAQIGSLTDDATSRSMARFYPKIRKQLDVLLESTGGPLGGKWSFDADNRKKIPRRHAPPPSVSRIHGNDAHTAAVALGEELPPYPITSDDTDRWLDEFIANRLDHFGPYEDALDGRDDRWYHALLTPMLNAGLITPRRTLEAVLRHAEERRRKDSAIPLNSLEGFIRQLIGWREFIRVTYHRYGRQMRTRNFWNHSRPIPLAFYEGTTGIPPVDDVIAKVHRLGWAHHIERLMVVGNVMLLCEFDPDAVYQWFMELFVDAYDWVMVPNVYGMSQYSDGGLITTKPYISGSNYIRKMSNFEPGPWQQTWDGLYWRFIDRHREFFTANARLALMPRGLDRLEPGRRRDIFHAADQFLEGM
ncbi:MAG: cryptochrome/photolyase family protein [Alkalispirochaeta sp.]